MSEESDNKVEPKKEEEVGYNAVVVDTLNALQNDKYMKHLQDKGNPNFNEWRDFGVEIYEFYTFLKNMGCEIVQVLGPEGTGKTVGAYFLNPKNTLYMNVDNKPLTFPEAATNYTEKNLKVPKTYEDVQDWIKKIHTLNKIAPSAKGRLTVFILAHIDYYNVNNATRERLKIIGKLATKMNIEGSVIHTYYTWVNPDLNLPEGERYKLLTRNTGQNTGRSPMNMWQEDKIPNNFQAILEKIHARR